METIKKFFEKNFYTIMGILLLLSFFNNCNKDRKLDEIERSIRFIKDSTYTKSELNTKLKISGLEAEKRMIQATDRKMMDVNRQNEIDKELKILTENE